MSAEAPILRSSSPSFKPPEAGPASAFVIPTDFSTAVSASPDLQAEREAWQKERQAWQEERKAWEAERARIIAHYERILADHQRIVQEFDIELQFLRAATGVDPEKLAALEKCYAQAKEDLKTASARVNDARSKIFRTKSEKNRRFKPKKTPRTSKEIETEKEERAKSRRKSSSDEGLKKERFFVHCPEKLCNHEECGKPLVSWPRESAEVSGIVRFVSGYFIYQEFLLQKQSCTEHPNIIDRAPAPNRPFEGKSVHSSETVAHALIGKFVHFLPHNRVQKILSRLGRKVSASTLSDWTLSAGEHLRPLFLFLLAAVKAASLVLADETYIRILDKRGYPDFADADPKIEPTLASREEQRQRCIDNSQRRPEYREFDKVGDRPIVGMGYMWLFYNQDSDEPVFYFSASRSGDTPKLVLGRSEGVLLADLYSGYNAVTKPNLRQRAGCNVHARRKFYELPEAEPARKEVLSFYEKVYAVEAEARERFIEGTDAHTALRQEKSKPVMEEFKTWLDSQVLIPNTALAKAVNYSRNNWEALTLFLTNARIPLDNNLSERTLCQIASARRSFLHVGTVQAGEAMATLMTLFHACEKADLDPEIWLAHILLIPRAELAANPEAYLPRCWKPPDGWKREDGVPVYGPGVKVERIPTE